MDDLISALILAIALMNAAYVGFRLRKDVRARDTVFIVLGIAATIVALTCVAVAGFIFWLEYTDFHIGW